MLQGTSLTVLYIPQVEYFPCKADGTVISEDDDIFVDDPDALVRGVGEVHKDYESTSRGAGH